MLLLRMRLLRMRLIRMRLLRMLLLRELILLLGELLLLHSATRVHCATFEVDVHLRGPGVALLFQLLHVIRILPALAVAVVHKSGATVPPADPWIHNNLCGAHVYISTGRIVHREAVSSIDWPLIRADRAQRAQRRRAIRLHGQGVVVAATAVIATQSARYLGAGGLALALASSLARRHFLAAHRIAGSWRFCLPGEHHPHADVPKEKMLTRLDGVLLSGLASNRFDPRAARAREREQFHRVRRAERLNGCTHDMRAGANAR